ncbi:transcriptional regulator [Mycobacteroides saopaulense]|uniref:Transcriptional regulator n=1 Tax=Mycobacteroides saopaulense TaxID=1578165 RepID=A0A1X0J9I7_9MYCO|nr:helix-turn-helix domain-containing protein [Mycobacteroides saopaulense]ORB58987.1 transcriptional regulator [Mycobacteroides saopaulense]
MTTELPDCGVTRFLAVLDGPWATLIIKELLSGPRRFTQLRQALPGISPHTLSSRLRRFEEHELLTRTVYAEIPPRVEYELTAAGQRLRPVFNAMDIWGCSLSPQLASPTLLEEDGPKAHTR